MPSVELLSHVHFLEIMNTRLPRMNTWGNSGQLINKHDSWILKRFKEEKQQERGIRGKNKKGVVVSWNRWSSILQKSFRVKISGGVTSCERLSVLATQYALLLPSLTSFEYENLVRESMRENHDREHACHSPSAISMTENHDQDITISMRMIEDPSSL